MRKILILMIGLTMGLNAMSQKTFHDFEATTIDGKTLKMSEFKGKKILVVNVASKCGLTPQYEDLQKLYDEYGGENFVIIGFPANNFLKQEPGTDEEIKTFCTKNYGVTFQMMSKISVKGDDMHPIYQWLTSKDQNGFEDSEVKWNFQKYLIDEEGKLVKVIDPRTKPMSDEIVSWITE
jgi:glutathione peroxidase